HRVLRKQPDRLDAWEAYQRGLWHFYKYTRQDNQIGLGFFRQAIALDPKFAPGHYGYALALQWDIWHFSDRLFAEVQQTPLDEARDLFGRIPAQFSSELRRFRQRPPWMRPEDYAIRQEGLRLAAGDAY